MELLEFIWEIISTLIDGVKNAIFFIKDLALLIPDFLSSFPSEISLILLPVFSIMVAIFIYKLVI